MDCHVHCYDLARQSFSVSSGFHVQENELGSVDDLKAVLDAHGLTHALLVNPLGGYGTDNSYLLQAVAEGDGRFRGVALLAEDVDDREVRRLIDGGIVGIRFNLGFPNSPPIHGPAGERALAIAREAGWFVQIHAVGDAILSALPILKRVDRVVIDHCGRPDITAGIAQPAFSGLIDLGRQGRAHIKLSACFRFSRAGWPFDDCRPFVDALIDAFSIDRCLWGSDWPFIRSRRRIDYGPQYAFLAHVVPDATERAKILWANPAQLCGIA